MKKKMKTRKKMKMLATPDVCVKVFGMLVLSCAIGHAQGHGYPNMPSLKIYTNTSNIDSEHVHRIVAFGDSLTEGSLHRGVKYYPYSTQLEERLNDAFNYTRFEVLNEGVSGECAYMSMATRLPKILERLRDQRIDLVIILGGTNDLRKLDCSKYVNVAYEIIALHKIVHKKNIFTLLCTIPENLGLHAHCEENRNKVNDKLRHFAHTHQNNTLFLDLAQQLPMKNLTKEERDLYWDDGVHPSKAGYEKMTVLLFQVVRKLYHVTAMPETRKLWDAPTSGPLTTGHTTRMSSTFGFSSNPATSSPTENYIRQQSATSTPFTTPLWPDEEMT